MFSWPFHVAVHGLFPSIGFDGMLPFGARFLGFSPIQMLATTKDCTVHAWFEDNEELKGQIFKPSCVSQLALVVKNLPVNAGDVKEAGSSPGLGRFPGEGNSKPLQYSCLENSTDRGAWKATVLGVTKSWTWLGNRHTQCILSTESEATCLVQ